MQILIDVAQAGDGRLTGTATTAHDDELPFSGNLELLARIEELCRRHAASPDQPNPDPKRSL
jgi:hypothetical protein